MMFEGVYKDPVKIGCTLKSTICHRMLFWTDLTKIPENCTIIFLCPRHEYYTSQYITFKNFLARVYTLIWKISHNAFSVN